MPWWIAPSAVSYTHLDVYKRQVKRKSYEKLIDYAIDLGVTNAFIQEGEAAKESFIPPFNGEGI